jgi:4-amino-4-deoxy-L-arabinose transferase-like glycosyltransferase
MPDVLEPVQPATLATAPPLPRSLFACLRLFWQQVLWPGKAIVPGRLRWSALLLVLILPGVLLYPCLAFPLFEPDEGRYAEIPREMLVRGEWIVPYLQGEPYLEKPPLLYWLVMASYRAFGVHDWAARLVPALAVHACVVLTFLFGRRTLGDGSALRGAIALGLAPGFMGMGRLLLLDGLLTLWVTLSLFSAFEAVRGGRVRWGWWLVAAVSCGLGMLTKGPVALLLLAPPLWLHRRLTGSAVRLRWWHHLAFAVVLLAVALPWYVALCVRAPEFARIFLWEHNVLRFLAPFDHLRPIWFYAPVVLVGLLPATLFVLPFLRFLLSGDSALSCRRTPELGFVLLVGGWCVVFFSLSGCKLPTYVLPAFPFLALAVGCCLAGPAWVRSRLPGLVAGVFFVVLLLTHYVIVPWYADYRSPMARAAEVERYCGDQSVPVLCYPRHCDTVSFYLGREDLRNCRSKDIEWLRQALREEPRTVVLCTHRHSLQGLQQALPPELQLTHAAHFALDDLHGLPEWLVRRLTRLAGETALGLCDIAVVERR